MRTLRDRSCVCLVSALTLLTACSASSPYPRYLTHARPHEQNASEPYPCDPGFAAEFTVAAPGDFYVVAVASWAERAGLQRGDRLVNVNGRGATALTAALRELPPRASFQLETERNGQRVFVTLPCFSHRDVWQAWNELLAAAAASNWSECDEWARHVENAQGFTGERLRSVEWYCAWGRGDDSRDFVLATYRRALATIDETRYVPGRLDEVRHLTIGDVELLQTRAPSFAADVQAELTRVTECDDRMWGLVAASVYRRYRIVDENDLRDALTRTQASVATRPRGTVTPIREGVQATSG